MAQYHEILRPERPSGTDAERWQQMYRYLYRLTEQLENISNMLSSSISELKKEGAKNDENL